MDDLISIIDISRLILGVVILSYASYTDIKTRRAANYLWLIMGVGGIILLVIHTVFIGFDNIFYLVFIPLMIGFIYLLFQLRLIFGGADAKALMALAILVPLQPMIYQLPILQINTIIFPGSWIIFSNSVILFLFIPLSLFIYNLIHRDIVFPQAFLGYQMSISEAQKKFVWPLEKIKNGKRVFSYRPTTFKSEKEFKLFKKLGIEKIWITPKIPFMIPLLAGFIATFFLGDILTQIINLIK
jgi:preflagellin peptidase FlaK